MRMSQSTLHRWICLGSSGMLRAWAICWGDDRRNYGFHLPTHHPEGRAHPSKSFSLVWFKAGLHHPFQWPAGYTTGEPVLLNSNLSRAKLMLHNSTLYIYIYICVCIYIFRMYVQTVAHVTSFLCWCCPSHLSVACGMPAASSALQRLHRENPDSTSFEKIYCTVVLKKMLEVLQ